MKVTKKKKPKKLRKLYTLQEETINYLETEFKDYENGRGVDELVRRYKNLKP